MKRAVDHVSLPLSRSISIVVLLYHGREVMRNDE